MKTLLRIDCSARTTGSHSRDLADHYEQKWRTTYPEGTVLYRDLTESKLPHIQNNTITGFYALPGEMTDEQIKATALSDELIAELKQVDEVLISSPLYNLNVPSSLKAYIDQVTRIGHTFNINENGYYGLLENKKATVITVKGGSYKGTPMEQYDFQEPYLKVILGHIGIAVDNLFSLEGTSDHQSLEEDKGNLKEVMNGVFTKN